jgi:CelD/BcsL family acetyltransferase involved in cellulose biosynthesis
VWNVLSAIDDIIDLSDAWNRLATADAECTVFQRAEWTQAWLHHLPGNRLPQVIVNREASEITAIFPMWLRTLNGFRILEFIGARGTDYLAPIMGRQHFSTYARFFDYIRAADSDIISFEDIPSTHSLVRYCEDMRPRSAIAVSTTCLCFQIGLHGTWCTYLSALSVRKRRDIAYDRRYFARNCPRLSFVPRANIGQVDRHCDLHQSRRNRVGDAGAYSTDEAQRFWYHVADRWNENGMLRLSFLLCAERPVASILAAEWRGRVFAMTFGMDMDFARLSPGSVLLGYCVEHSIERGARSYDLSRGDDRYKRTWGAFESPNVHVILSDSWDALHTYKLVRGQHFAGFNFAPSSR